MKARNNFPNCKPIHAILVIFEFVNLMLSLHTDSVNTTNNLKIERATLCWIYINKLCSFGIPGTLSLDPHVVWRAYNTFWKRKKNLLGKH